MFGSDPELPRRGQLWPPCRRKHNPEAGAKQSADCARHANSPQPFVDQHMLADAVHGSNDQRDHSNLDAEEDCTNGWVIQFQPLVDPGQRQDQQQAEETL